MNRILIVDDDAAIRMLYEDELDEEGYEVFTCGDGSRVMNLIEQNGPDLLLMEIRLSKYNGLDLLQDVRNRHPNLPVVLYIDAPGYEDHVNCVAADDVFVKSSNLEGLKEKIGKVMYKHQPLESANERTGIPSGFGVRECFV